MRREGLRVDYERLPGMHHFLQYNIRLLRKFTVTDEQAPIPQIYSRIEQRVSTALRSDAALAFNCQMGRGRTSTGMQVTRIALVESDLTLTHSLQGCCSARVKHFVQQGWNFRSIWVYS